MTQTLKRISRLYYSIIIIISAVLLSACGGSVTGNTTPNPQTSFEIDLTSFEQIDFSPGINSGTIQVLKNKSETINVNYTIFVPQHSDGERLPHVFGLHGRGQSADHLVRYYLTPSLGDLGGIIFGIDAPENGDWLDGFSESLVKQLLDLSIANWPVDSKKVVLTGYSMGGTGAWNILTRFRSLFSAAIPIASTPQPWVEEPAASVPLYIIHGENDTFFPLKDIEEAVASLRERGAFLEFIVIPGIQHEEIYETVPYLYQAIDWLQTKVWLNE